MSRHSRRSRAWQRQRRTIFERDGYRCQACGKAALLEAHHIDRVADGGQDAPDNLKTVCRGCHIDIHRPVESAAALAWSALVKNTGA